MVGIPGLIAAFLIWRTHEPQRGAFDTAAEYTSNGTTNHGSRGKDFLTNAQRLLRIPTYWVLLAAFVFSLFSIGAEQFWIPSYLTKAFQLTASQACTISGGVLAGSSLIGTLLGGWAADALQCRLPQGRMIISTVAFLVGSPLTLLALSFHTLTPFIITFILAITCLCLCLGPLYAMLQDITPPAMRATGGGLVMLVAHLLGDAASPSVIGMLADKFSLGTALLVTVPLCLFIAGLVCLQGLKTVANDMQAMQAALAGGQSKDTFHQVQKKH
jgi:sugar phosphate permease